MPDLPIRILFVFAWLVVGGEETEVRHLARRLDPRRYRLEVVACFRRPEMPEQTHVQLEALGVAVDRTPYALSFEDTVAYLASKVCGYDLIVSCQNVADIYPALNRLHLSPPLIEHGGLVREVHGPKHRTARYVGVCRTIREAAAALLPGREHHALEIPSMVDLSEFAVADRSAIRAALGVAPAIQLVGWVGRLDRKKRVEDFLEAAAVVRARRPAVRFVVIGGPDAFMPEYAAELRAQAERLALGDALTFLGDRADVPALLSALDVLVWLSRDEGMPHVIAEAGAARLPVVATADNGTTQQIDDGVSGVFVPHQDPAAAARAVLGLLDDPDRAGRLGRALRARVERQFSVEAVLPQWERLFDDVLAERRAQPRPSPELFRSFVQGGFECSTHRRADGRRLDVIAATAHDTKAASDYAALGALGIRTVRDGLRWHRIEAAPGRYDWSSFLPMLRATRTTGTQVIWDVLHYGWPDDVDVFRPHFVTRLAAFAGAAARVVRDETDEPPFYAPVNEISFFAWGGGDAGYLNPFARGRGHELKVQLTRAAIAVMDAIWEVEPRARFVHADPVINVITDPSRPHEYHAAEGHRQAQFQAWDMLSGASWPQLGGSPRHLDIVGVNYYSDNQWIHGGPPIDLGHPLYKPFRTLLIETFARFGRPILIAETGTEGDRRAAWMSYVADEAQAAMRAGVPLEGICLYPVLDHPGWDDDRYCPNGLLGMHDRSVHGPLASVVRRELCRARPP